MAAISLMFRQIEFPNYFLDKYWNLCPPTIRATLGTPIRAGTPNRARGWKDSWSAASPYMAVPAYFLCQLWDLWSCLIFTHPLYNSPAFTPISNVQWKPLNHCTFSPPTPLHHRTSSPPTPSNHHAIFTPSPLQHHTSSPAHSSQFHMLCFEPD